MMKKVTIRQTSIRNRLIVGVGFMLLPLVVIAGGAFFFFEQAINTIEKSENNRLEELFPLDRLEESLRDAYNVIDQVNAKNLKQSQGRFIDLSKEIDRRFVDLLNTPSQLAEKRRLLLGIEQEWQQANDQSKRLFRLSASASADAVAQRQQPLKNYLSNAASGNGRLINQLINFKSNDNLQRARDLKQQARFTIMIISAAAIMMAIASALVMARGILKPLKVLNRGVAHFGDGDLSHRIDLKTQDELELLANAINWMADNLEKSQQALIELATMDGLTGVFNRREFNRHLTIEIERSRREGHSVSLLMVDADHFKRINDTYGHQSGDDVLRFISALIKQEIRPGDLPARYGGEEFAVILPYADSNDAFVVAERLRNLMAAQDIAIQDGQSVKVTASLGCATFPADAQTEAALMAMADAALYRAKKGGRNRVCLASQEMSASNDFPPH
jgi:two-component system, cell cycle response regulator